MAQEESVRGEMHVLEQRHALALSRLEHLQREREQARRAVDPLRETQRGITTRLSRATAAEESIAAYNQQRKQLQAQQRQPQDTVRSPLRFPTSEARMLAAQIPELRAQLAQHNRRQQHAENTAEQVARQHRAQQQQVDALVANQREQEETLAALMAAEDQQRAVLRDVVAQMAGLAPSIMEKVTEEVTYPVQTIARRCTVQATVTWRDGQATVYAAQQEDIDTVHEAAAQGQVAEDPLRFVRTDQQRLQAAEQVMFAQVQQDAGCCMVDAVANNR
jgi:chromosome segregation ATPase